MHSSGKTPLIRLAKRESMPAAAQWGIRIAAILLALVTAVVSALLGGGDTAAAAEEIKLRSRQYAKRQLTWFRRNQAAKWLRWDHTPDFAAALQASTGYIKEFGI